MSSAKNVKVSRDEKNWEFVLEAELPADVVQKYRAEALKDIGRNAQIAGFRPGHVPETVLIKQYGETAILNEAAELAVKSELPEILAEEKANIVEAPRVSVDTPVAGSPLKFSARAPLAPEIKLPDYKGIAKKMVAKKEVITVSDDEHKDTTIHLRRERARIEKIEAGAAPDKALEEAQKAEEKDLPALDDEFVKSLGYESAEDFSNKLREHIKTEKELGAKNKFRAELLEALVKDSRISYPSMLREYELDDMEGRLQSDVERMGKKLDSYLAETKKTREQLRAEWKDAADKRAKIRLVLSEIARQEKVEADPEKLAHEFEHAKKHHPQADPDALHAHLSHALRNEQVLDWLEKQG
ncbi:hypothetical protein HY969_03035 [Candidatus Kaiserbacteria bacterium]|nr:hypothetical protein [Candidatus Kaiserbacteria bacterium]